MSMPPEQTDRPALDPQSLLAAMPYARMIGFDMMRDDSGWKGHLAPADILMGNPGVHGGAVGGLLQCTALCTLLLAAGTSRAPRMFSSSTEYLRMARLQDIYAHATVEALSRRFANVRAVAYQDDPRHPVAAATMQFLLVD